MPTLLNRSRICQRLLGPVRKTLQVRLPQTRPVLEQMLYAVCRRDVPRSEADAAFSRLQQAFYDWNEVRVSAVREVADALAPLPQAFDRAEQLVRLLQEVFEAHYCFDLDGLKKKPLRQAEKQLHRLQAADPFVLAWTMQYALGGHAVPVDESVRRVVVRLGLVQDGQPTPSVQTSLAHQFGKAQAQPLYEILSAVAHRYCREEPVCGECPLQTCCPTARQSRQPITPRIRRTKPR